MKKIFAFILASIMVLSLVPASAFAAFNMCPDTHTKANCDYVFVTSFPASCSTYGYSVYECKTCGTEFLDDFSDELSHSWISTADSKHVNKAATCTTEGWEWVKCAVCTTYIADTVPCGGACGDDNCMLYKKVIKPKHNPVATGNGVGCETEYKCTVCDTILYYDAANKAYVLTLTHQWDYQKAETVVTPSWNNGVFTKGEALVKCSVKNCPGEKTVEISDMACRHDVYTLVKAFVKETCTTAGTYGVYACRDCDKYVVDTNGDGVIDADLKDKDNKATKDLSYAVVEALGHKVPAEGYLSVVNCVGTYSCANCKAVLTKTVHMDLYDIVEGEDVPATCTNDGYDYQYCRACFTSVPVILPKTGHKTKTIEIKVTCVNQGAKYTFCINDNCTIVPQLIRDAKGEHKATLEGYGLAANTIVSAAPYNGYYYNLRLTKAAEKVTAIKASEHKLKYDVLNDDTADTFDKKPTADCSGYKIVQTICSNGCSAATTELIAQGAHSEYVSKKYATCNEFKYPSIAILDEPAKEIALNPFFVREEYSCKVCKKVTRYVDTPVQFAMEYADEKEIGFYHGDIEYVADAKYKLQPVYTNPSDLNANKVANAAYAKNPTCLTTGLEFWDCDCCKVVFYKTVAKTLHTKVAGTEPTLADYTGGKAATCEKPGTWDYLTCVYCKNTVIWNKYTEEQQVVSSLVIAAHGSTLEHVVTTTTATECAGVTYYKCTADGCGKTFTDWTAKTTYKVDADHHDWVILQAGVPATCTTDGVYEIKYCNSKDCRRIEINAFIIDEGKVIEETRFEGERLLDGKNYADTTCTVPNMNRKSDGKFENKDVKITAKGALGGAYSTVVPKFNHKVPFTNDSALTTESRAYAKDHSTPSYDAKQCSYCDYEYFTNYVEASGAHKNKNGEVLTTECDNAYVADRICIFCSSEDKNNDGVADNVIEPKHDYGSEIKVAPTCVLGGYTYKMCKDCGYRDIIEVTAKNADNYHKSDAFKKSSNFVEVGSQSNYASAGSKYSAYCKLCNKEVLKVSDPAKIKEAGLEIFVSTDADLYIPGSTVYVTITLDSLKGVDVWAVNFPVTYDAKVFKYVGYTFNTADSDFQTFAANDVTTYKNRSYDEYYDEWVVADTLNLESVGVINVVANADNNVTVKGSQVLAVLEFEVISLKAADATFTVDKEDCKGSYLKGYETIVYSPTYSKTVAKVVEYDYNATALNASGKEVNCMIRDNKVNVEVADLLDLDDDGKISMLDAYKLYTLIFNNEYNVVADADCDGRVTGLDLAVLYSILTGAETVDSYINPGAYADITPIQPRND